MPCEVLEYKCFLASPSDVVADRDALTSAVGKWNAQIGSALNARIELVRWESHALPALGRPPQEEINRQLVDGCDLGIALFWTRLGTPTEDHSSGTLEEIRQLVSRGARVLLYLCSRPIPQSADLDEVRRLREELDRFKSEGLLASYSDEANLREQVQLHLTRVIAELIARDRPELHTPEHHGVAVLPKPHIKVKAGVGLGIYPSGLRYKSLDVDVQNHSPLTVFLRAVVLKLRDGRHLVVRQDCVTGESQRRRELRPGEAFTVHFVADDLFAEVGPEDLVGVLVKDDIDRVYESDEGEFRQTIQALSVIVEAPR